MGDSQRKRIRLNSSEFSSFYWWSDAYLPMHYPLLFPRGEDGFVEDISFGPNSAARSIKRDKITLRLSDKGLLLFGRRLYQQFLVDGYSMIESTRLQWIRFHQSDLHADIYSGLSDAVLRGESSASATGKRIILPSTFVGGARYMIQNYEDAMAICAWAGYPDLFITFTCNHKWPELKEYFDCYDFQSQDRPDMVSKLFKIKLDQLIRDIKSGDIFGGVRSVIYTIEFQKRGLPHAHILVFLSAIRNLVQAKDIDRMISAELPDKETDPYLFSIVTSCMIHGPCGDFYMSSPCMQTKRCSKYYPKPFLSATTIDKGGYPLYRRRNDGKVYNKGSFVVDNRWVVPYNRDLLLKYNAHINVEWCNQIRSIKYLFKYVNKGHDRVTTGFYNNSPSNPHEKVVDEIKLYYDCRYLSACEAAWRVFSFDIHYREPSVERLTFHLPDKHFVVYDSTKNVEEVLKRKHIKNTKFIAWMSAHIKYPKARKLTYGEFPSKFVWKEKRRDWVPHQKGFSVGRMRFVPPSSGELYYLRMLLSYVKGATCYEDIMRVNNDVCSTFKDACIARCLLEDDGEYIKGIIEASIWGTAGFLRRLFVTLLMSNQFARPEVVWDATWKYMSDDILYRQRKLLKFLGFELTTDEIHAFTLLEVQLLLLSNNRNMSDFNTMPQPDMSLSTSSQNKLIMDELNYDKDNLRIESLNLLSTMTAEQLVVYNTIIERVRSNKLGLFFLYGYGGTGKTYIWRVLASTLRSQGDKCVRKFYL